MNAKKRYDKKVRLTRILLSDYLLLKGFAQKAGVSMAVALHRLIEHVAQLPLPKPEPVVVPKSQPTFQVSAPVALRIRSQPTIATNGGGFAAFRIKPKGVRYE